MNITTKGISINRKVIMMKNEEIVKGMLRLE